jgi:hypothetical protein
MNLTKIDYVALNDRQKENYNFQKIAAILADYGFNCIRLSDDYMGADFLALHIDGTTVLKVQLKGRLNLEDKYVGKDLFEAFPDKGRWFLVPHDEARDYFAAQGLQTSFSRGYIRRSTQLSSSDSSSEGLRQSASDNQRGRGRFEFA